MDTKGENNNYVITYGFENKHFKDIIATTIFQCERLPFRLISSKPAVSVKAHWSYEAL